MIVEIVIGIELCGIVWNCVHQECQMCIAGIVIKLYVVSTHFHLFFWLLEYILSPFASRTLKNCKSVCLFIGSASSPYFSL